MENTGDTYTTGPQHIVTDKRFVKGIQVLKNEMQLHGKASVYGAMGHRIDPSPCYS